MTDIRPIIDRNLPDRSRLSFYFPVASQANDYYIVELPFFENIDIKESKKARYQKYSLISRSSNLYSYLGADSRKFNLSFNITLPHLLDEHRDINSDTFARYKFSSENVELEKRRFLTPAGKTDKTAIGISSNLAFEYTRELAAESATQVINALRNAGAIEPKTTIDAAAYTTEEEYLASRYNVTNFTKAIDAAVAYAEYRVKKFGPYLSEEEFNKTFANVYIEKREELLEETRNQQNIATDAYKEQRAVRDKAIDLIVYWVNIIRASVSNNSKNPLYGPPIIRLQHGVLYQDVPCICQSYNMEFNEAAGYDLDTLLPRQIRITLSLEEMRAGDFGEFDSQNKVHPVKRDNLAGWEAVILGDSNNMDPGYLFSNGG